jgi:hypothetical protein
MNEASDPSSKVSDLRLYAPATAPPHLSKKKNIETHHTRWRGRAPPAEGTSLCGDLLAADSEEIVFRQ